MFIDLLCILRNGKNEGAGAQPGVRAGNASAIKQLQWKWQWQYANEQQPPQAALAIAMAMAMPQAMTMAMERAMAMAAAMKLKRYSQWLFGNWPHHVISSALKRYKCCK